MSYRSLPDALTSTADTVADYFKKEHGLRSLKIEAAIDDDIRWRPTISGTTTDYHSLCIEVTSGSYTSALDGFVLDCMNSGLPVRLYIACPDEDGNAQQFLKTFAKAKTRGVGLIQVKGKKCTVLANPIELSLASVRRVDSKDLLPKHRQAMRDAEATFLGGDPVSGCSRVFAEIEQISRRFASKSADMQWWDATGIGDIDSHPWSPLMTSWMEGLTYKTVKQKCPKLTRALIGSVIGLTAKRNETGPHKPKGQARVIQRNKDLRTRFELAVQVFIELQDAGRPLRI